VGDRSRRDAERSGSNPDPKSADSTSDSTPPSTAEESTAAFESMTVPELVGVLSDRPIASSRRLLSELLDRGETAPEAFRGRIDELLAVVNSEDETRAWIGSATLAALAAANPGLLAPYGAELVDALDGTNERTDEYVRDALCTLARRRSVPVEGLVDRLERGDSPTDREAALVLGSVAGTAPDELPIERLERLYRDGDTTTRGCAGYVLAVLAAERPRDVTKPAPTPEGVIDLTTAVKRAEFTWVSTSLQRAAVRLIVEDAAPDAPVDSFEMAATPAGSQLVLYSETPEALTGADGGTIRELTAALEERLDMEPPEIEVQKPRR
jgi:hypothetical protein